MNKIKKDPLFDLFAEMPREKLSGSFREKMMTRVREEELRRRKMNRLWSIIGMGAAIVCLIVVTGFTAWNINWHIDWQDFRIPSVSWTPAFPFYGYIFFLVGVLLWLDHLMRRNYKKKHKEDID